MSCKDQYKNRLNYLKNNRDHKKEKVADMLTLGGVSSSGALISSSATPGMVLLGMASFAGGGYLSSTLRNERVALTEVAKLFKDAKIKKGYFLQDATGRVRQYFGDNTITEEEVLAVSNKQLAVGKYCEGDKLIHAGDMLLMVGKEILANRAINRSTKVHNGSRSVKKRIPGDGFGEDSGGSGVGSITQ